MKSNYVFIFIALCCLKVTAQENLLPDILTHRSDEFVLDSQYYWQWQAQAKDWKLFERTFYTLDDNKNIIREWDMVLNAMHQWVNYALTLYNFNTDNQLTEEIRQNWDGNTWVNASRTGYTYNANDDQVSVIEQSWSGIWVNLSQELYTYNQSHNVLTRIYQAWIGSEWIRIDQLVHTYDVNNKLLMVVSQSWNGTWTDNGRSLYMYDGNDDLDTLLSQNWIINAWKDQYRSLYDFDSNHNCILIQDQITDGNGGWEDQVKNEFRFDQFNNITNWSGLSYINGIWIPIFQSNYLFDNDQNMLSEVHQNWDDEWINGDSSRYYYTKLTSVDDLSAILPFSFSPNPAHEHLTIEFEKAFNGQISIYDLQGKLVANQRSFTENVARLNVSALLPGQYIMVLRSGNGTEAKSFQKF
jgi:hypothetical protein